MIFTAISKAMSCCSASGTSSKQNCRRSDVVARYGGDEFVILMPETTIEQARQLANKLRGWIASDPLLAR